MGFFSDMKDAQPKNVFKRLLSTHYPDFNPVKEIWACDESGVIVIDETNTKIAIGVKLGLQEMTERLKTFPKDHPKPDLKDMSIDLMVYDYSQILSVEIIEDGNSVTKTSRTSQAASAALGALLFGGIGAVVGGLSAKQKTSNTVTKIEVNIIFNDIQRPRFSLLLLKIPSPKTGILYKDASNKANDLCALINVLIKRADDETAGQEIAAAKPAGDGNSADIPSQIRKLAELKADGILGEEEFEKKKAELLGRM